MCIVLFGSDLYFILHIDIALFIFMNNMLIDGR